MEKNPAPVDMVKLVNIPWFTLFYTSQVMQDFFYQQQICEIGLEPSFESPEYVELCQLFP